MSDDDLEAALESVEGSGLVSARAGFIVEKGLVNREVASVSTSTPLGDIGLWIDDSEKGAISFGMASNAVWKMACLRLSFPHGPRSEILRRLKKTHDHYLPWRGDSLPSPFPKLDPWSVSIVSQRNP